MKNLNLQKIIGIILSAMAISLIGFILFFSADFRASEKVFDKYITAIKYKNEDELKKNILSDAKNDLTAIIQKETTEEKKFKSVSYKIINKHQNGNEYVYNTKTSIFYDDDTSTKINLKVTMQKDKKWKIKSIEIVK